MHESLHEFITYTLILDICRSNLSFVYYFYNENNRPYIAYKNTEFSSKQLERDDLRAFCLNRKCFVSLLKVSQNIVFEFVILKIFINRLSASRARHLSFLIDIDHRIP